jgi:hypothetical protein
MNAVSRLAIVILGAFLLLSSAVAHAGASLAPPEKPTQVTIALNLVALSRVDPPNEIFPTFSAELTLVASWNDPRLAFETDTADIEPRRFHGHAAEEQLDHMWWPDLAVENEEGARAVEHRELDIYPNGRVRYVERFSVRASADLDLRRFPFDTQHLEVRIAPFSWDHNYVQLVAPEAGLRFSRDHTSPEWVVRDFVGRVETADRSRQAEPVSVLRTFIVAERHPGFYLYKLLLPLVLIVVFTWSAFWMRGEASTGRMQRTFVALLTVVAFHHIVAGHLPKIPYLTFVDAVVYAAFLSVGATLLQVVRIHNAQHAGQTERVERMERTGRWGHPVGFALTLIVLWIVFHTI